MLERRIIRIDNVLWLVCECGQKLCKIKKDINPQGVIIFCKKCHKEYDVGAEQYLKK